MFLERERIAAVLPTNFPEETFLGILGIFRSAVMTEKELIIVSEQNSKILIDAEIAEYVIPPFKNMLVLGIDSPIGCIAARQALKLLVRMPFQHIEIRDDDVISDILVREALLRRVKERSLIDFVLTKVKPLMNADEIMQINMNIRILLSSNVK